MDRGGEELVAIVQSLDSPGVTVTVSSRSRHDVERRRSSRATIHINTVNRAKVSPAAEHSVDTMPATPGEQSASVSRRASVKTTTDADFAKLSKGSQICDDRYTSSYKLAHCQMTPSSPPEAVSEFPLQRREPCRNEGNFEIGRNRSAQSSFHIEQGSGQSFGQPSRNGQVRASTSRMRQNGGSLMWRDKGSSHRYCNTKRDLDAFEQSLRKYPSMGSLRTASHDLIEKLIRYTQAKNFQEMSRSSKSVRSLRHQKSADTKDWQSKQQQTYTRRQDNNLPSSSGVQVGHVGRTRNFKLYSPTSDSRNIRNRETAFSTSYDYLNAGSPPDGRSNRSDGSPSPTGSRSPEDSRSPDRSPVRFGSPVGSKGPGSLDKSRPPERPLRFERSVRDLSLSEMSKHIRNTVRQICNEKPLVFQMCPKLKDRYDQHKRTCPSMNEQTSDLVDTGCQCKRSDCHCARATQCAYDSEVPTKTVGCSCRTRTIEAKTSCQRDLACVCTRKAEELAYYYKKIDEAISIWLKDVPVHNIECTANKRKRETAIKKLRQILKQLPDDEDFDENVRNEVSCFIDDFPLWNPGKDEDEENMFKNQLVDKLIDTILAIPRKPDRFREIVTKWVENLDFKDDDEEIDMEAVIDNFVNKLNPLAAERPACDMKYMQILRKEITELLVELPLSYDSAMLKKKAHQLATEIVNLPRNIKLSGSTTSTSVFEENISEWVCEHGMCRELKKDPKLIEGLAYKLKSQGIGDEEVIETMKELISEFVDDVDTAIGVLDEFVDELMKTFPSFVEKGNLYSEPNAERFDVDELHEVVSDWISNLPGASDFFLNKFEEITEDIVTMIHDSIKQGNEDLGNNIFEYIADTGLPIDLGVLHTHVDELMERLNILPPSEDVIDQAKKNMIQEMFKVINASSMSEEKQEEFKRSALKLVQRKASMMSSLNFLEDQDDVKEALLSDMNRIVNKILGEGQNELKDNLRTSLSTTFDKSFVRLGKDESDLKQIVEKKVRKAIDVLPVDTIRKEDLMGQVNKILCKRMNQPLPPNIKNIINDNISNILEKCPISEDRSLCGRLKKTLFDVVGQHLDMLLPKPVCDFQCKTEDDVGMVIDRCPIDPGTKTQLKKCIQDIFTKNGDRLLSEEAVRTIEEEIHGVCSNLPIPKDKKAILVKAVGASVSKNLKDALLSLRHDLIKLRKRLYVTMTNVIEKSPITRDVKTNLKSQIESVLVRNLDSSLSDKEKQNILDEVSIVLKDDMPEEKIKNLTNILSNKMDAFQRIEKTKDLAEMITKDIDQLVNSLPIDSYAKKDFRKDIKAVLLDTLYNPLTNDTQQKIKKDITNEIDDIDIPKNEKNYLKSNVAHAVSKQLNELIAQGKEAPEIATSVEETIRNKIKDSTIPKDKQELLNHKLHDVLANNLVRDVTNEEKEVANQKLSDIVDDLKIDKGKTEAVKTQLLNNAHKYFEIPARDRIQTKESIAAVDKNMSENQRDYQIQNKILQSLENSIDDALIPEVKKIELKTKLKNIIAKNTKEPLSGDATELTQLALKDLENKTKQNIVRGLENVIAKAPIPKEEKKRLKKQLKDLATQQFKRRLSGDVAVGLKKNMDEIIDEMNLSKTEKDKLKSELTATVDDNISNLRNKTKPKQKQIEGFKELENETEGNIVRGLENVIDAAPIPKEKKIQLMKKLKDLTTQQFKRQLSDDVTEELKNDMGEIIDEMNLPTDTKVKLKSELTATVDDNMSDMHRKIKDADSNFSKTKSKQLEQEIQTNIKRRLENVIDAAPIPKEKKIQLMKKLKDLTTQQFKRQLSDDVAEGLKDDMVEIIDEMNLPTDTKVKLKSELTATVDDNMSEMHRKIKDADSNFSKPKSKQLEQETQTNIKRTLQNVIDAAPIPKEKKIQLMNKLKDLTTQQFKRQLSDDVAEELKDDMVEIIDEMNLPKDTKVKLKSELTATVDDNMSDMHRKIKDADSNFSKPKSKQLEQETQTNIKRTLQNVIDAAPIPKEKKIQLMKKLTDLTTQQFKRQLSDDVAEELKDDMVKIIDEMNLPKDTKVKLKSGLTATVDDNMSDMHRKIKDAYSNFSKTQSKELEQESQTNIERRLENVIDAAPIPKEKNIQLMKKLMDLTTQQFKSQLTDDVVEGLKGDMGEIIDEMNLPEDKKIKLKSELTAAVDDNMSNLRNKIKQSQQGIDDLKALENETKGKIIRELENVVAVAPIPKEKKSKLKKQFKDLATQQFKNHLSDDVAVGLKNDRDEIIDEMNIPKDKKMKVKSELNATVDDNMSNLRSKTKPSQKGHVDLKALAKETEVNMARELEKVVDAAPIPKEKKIQLMKKLKNLTTQQFKSQLSDDVVEGLKHDMGEIIDEMDLSKDKKIKLKSELNATVDDNMSNLRTKTKSGGQGVDGSKSLENETKRNIMRELENVIDAAPIPKEKKNELKKQFKDLATQHFKNHLSDDVAVGLKDDMYEIIDEMNLPKDKKMKLKSELSATVDDNMINLQSKIKPSQKGHVDLKALAKETEVNMARELENIVDTAPIPKEKKIQLMKKLKNLMTQQFKSQLSDDVVEELKDDMGEIIDEMNLPKDTKVKLKSELTATVDDNMSDMHRKIKDADSLKSKEEEEIQTNIKRRLENVIDAAPIPKEKKVELKKKLKDLAIQQLNSRLFDDDTAGLKDNMSEIIDNLNLPKDKERWLKSELNATVDEHNISEKKRKIKHVDSNLRRPGLLSTEENKKKDRILQGIEKVIEKSAIPENKKQKLSGVLQKIATDHLKKRFSNDVQDEDSIQNDDLTELETKTQSNILLGQDEAVAKAKIPKELRKYLKNRLKELTKEHFMKPLTDDTAQELKDEINKEIDGLNLTEHLKDQLKKELDEAVVENMRNLLKHLEDLKINPKTIKDEGLKDIFDKFGIHPSYQKQLAEELNKLLDIARRGGDLEDARKKLIKKLMRDLNLPDEEASSLADELINKARKMALKEHLRDLSDKYSIDSSYEDQMAEEFNKLLEIARRGGDLEDARRKLIKKLMRDLNLPDEEASALADELINKARKMALKEHLRDLLDKYSIDPSYEDQVAEEFNKLLEIARKGGDLEDARRKLIKKLMRDLNQPEEEASAVADELIDKARKMALKEHLRNLFDKYGIDPSYEDQLAEEFNKLLEIARKGGDLDDAKVKLIKILTRDLNLSEAKASSLADDLIAGAREMALSGKITEAFTHAISDAVDQSTVAKADKTILKNRLLSKLKQILNKKPYIHKDDIGPLKEEVLKECNEIVDESSIPTDEKNELKQLLKEKLDKASDEDGAAESLADYKDKITKVIQKWMDSLPIHLDPKVAATVADNIASDILHRHKYLHVHPEAKSSEKDEIENLKYQVFRQMYRVVNPKAMPKITERTPDLYKAIMKIKPPPQEPKRIPKPKDAFAKAVHGAVDQKPLSLEEDPLAQNKMKELKKLFAKSVDQAIVESSLSKPDKSTLKKRLLEDLGITWADRKKAEKYDVGPSDAMDKSPTALEYKNKIRECVKTWLETLPIDIDPKTAATIADNLTNDILERQKYLRSHLETASTDEDEIQNLMFQVFRRLKDIVDPERIPDILKRTEDLYNMIMNIKKELESRQEGSSSKRRRGPSSQDRKKSTSVALISTGNINFSLRELIASTTGVRKQWSRNVEDAITKKTHAQTDEILKDMLATYDKIGQIDTLSTVSRSNTRTSAYQGPSSTKQFAKSVPMTNGKSRLSKIEKAFAFNNTTKQNSPFNPNKNQITEKDYEKVLNGIITNWLDKAKVKIAPKEKNEIVGELVRDIIERQKYLQEHEHANVSRSDDLEFLKSQVHGRLDKLVPAGSLKTIVESTGELSPPPITPPKSAIKSPVSKRKKQNRNSQASTDTSTEEILNNKKTVDDDALKDEMSNTEFRPGQASTPNKRTGEEYEDKVIKSTRSWIESVPINLEPDVQTEVINDLANDIIDRQKYLQVHPEKIISKKEEIENLRFQVFKRLDKVTEDESLIPDIDKIEELYKMINGDGRRKNLTPKEAQEFQTTLPDEIAAVLNDYNICCERKELLSSITKELVKLGNSNADQDEIIENLTDAIKRITYLSNCDMCEDEAEDLAYKLLARTKKLIARIQQSKGAPVKRRDFREAVMNDIGDVFHGCPMSADKRNMMECQLAEDYAEDLGIPLQDSETTMTGAGHYGMSFNGLTNFIDTWLSSIHTEDDDDTKEDSEINDKKKEMAYSLIHKIGEMNVDPEIFNDDALYVAILRDELQNMLGDITISEDELERLKEELINKVLEAKQRAHDEFAGQAYKRKLRDTISKVLPYQRNLSKEEQATLNTLKDQLADAYIDLHFSGNNEPQREKLKRKISNELSRFCKDYINKVPCAPLSSKKLNQDLYAALNAVPLPAKDSIRYEVEQARIREEINDWLKELPIQPQNPTELLARNKMVYVLAKKLFDIEIEGNDTDNDSKRSEIVKFLNRLPLETEDYLETLADTLIDKLKETEESRKYNASSNVTLDSFGNVSMDPRVCSKHKSLFEKRKGSPGPSGSQVLCGRPTCKQPKPMPPCTLSPEDKDYLERIRRRNCLSQGCVKSIIKDNKPKTCPGVRSIDTGSQTTQKTLGYRKPRSPICQIADKTLPRPCSGQPADAYSQQRTPCDPQQAPVCPVSQQKTVGPCPRLSRASSQCSRQLRKPTISCANTSDGDEEVQPQITIKKYYWNPNDENARGNRDPSLRHQASPTRIRLSSGAQCSPPPCGRPLSLCKLQQQDTGPQIRSDPKCQREPSSSPYETVTQRSFQPFCAPSPNMGPFGLKNRPTPSSSPFSKRDNECRIPKKDGLDHQDQMPCSSCRPSRKERVIKLGSLDNLSNPRPEKRQNDANDWRFEDEEDDNFWYSPIRRVILDEGIDDSVVMEREQREERMRCNCKERLVPKSQAGRAQSGNFPSQQFTQGNDVGPNLKKCSKCCGRHCPYPSYLYFRQ